MNRFAVVVHLHEFAPVGRRAASGRDGWRFERLTKRRENLTDGSRLSDQRDEPDVAAAPWTLQWKLLPDPSHQFRLGNPRGVV